jgi:hypothetical protein
MDMIKPRRAGSRLREKVISRQRRVSLWLMLFILLFVYSASGGCFKAQASEQDLVISEIMYDVAGSDAGHEWIEIFNSGSDELVVSSTWRFFDGSNHNINLYQGTSTVVSNEFFVLADNAEQFLLDYPDFVGNIYDTVMSLPNSSSSLALSFDSGVNYDLEEHYDSLWGANGNSYSLEKINYATSSLDNWQESAELGGTPGQTNSDGQSEEEIPPEDDDPIEDDPIQAWSQLIINEFLPNPEGSDDGEWIELYNNGPEILNLEGLKIKDQSARIFTLDIDDGLNLNLLTNNYLLLPKSITGISLNNTNGDGVIIMDPDENIIQSVEYSGTALEGRSYARSDNGFVWTKTPTPGQVNQISINQVPIAQISVDSNDFLMGEKINFSASLSYDPEGDDLDYLWQFGDGANSSKENIKHSFDNPGAYTITLMVYDPEGASDSIEFNLKIFQAEPEIEDNNSKQSEEAIDQDIIMNLVEDDLIISEFIPNPVGSDDNEWIELYNASDKDIDLYAWHLDDADGGSKPYQFATSTIILAKDFLVLSRVDTKITLNNSSDSVRLLNSAGEVFQEVVYQKIPEGKSYAWDNQNSEWFVAEPSLGQENIFVTAEAAKESKTIYSVVEINDLEKNQDLIVQGVVINNVGSDDRSLYLADYNFASINFEEIVEIYSYHKNFPDIKAGELVTVSGKISKLDDLPRIKITEATDIWQNDLQVALAAPEITEVENIEEDLLGAFVNIKGVVVKKSGKNIYLASDIEEEYIIRVYSKFSTKDLEIKKGNEMIVAGILSETDSSLKLVPFEIGDLSVSQAVLGAKIEAANYEETAISTSTSQIIAEDRKNSIKNILIFIIIGIVLISLVFFIKKRSTH